MTATWAREAVPLGESRIFAPEVTPVISELPTAHFIPFTAQDETFAASE